MTGLVATAALRTLITGPLTFLGHVWVWIASSATHVLAALLALACLFGLWQGHEAAKWHKVANSTAAARKADSAIWASADRVNHASITTCVGSLEQWSAATRGWAAAASAKQSAAQAALGAATARGRASEALAHRLDAEAALAPGTGQECRSGQTVLSNKGSL